MGGGGFDESCVGAFLWVGTLNVYSGLFEYHRVCVCVTVVGFLNAYVVGVFVRLVYVFACVLHTTSEWHSLFAHH